MTVRATPAAAGLEVRGAVTTDGTDFWLVAESGGAHHYQAGGSSTTQLNAAGPAARTGPAVADGQFGTATASGTSVRIGSLGTGMPTTSGQSVAALGGVPTSAGSPHALFFADLSAAVAGADTLYVADDSARALSKYSLAGGTWTADGTVGAGADDYWGLTGRVEDGTVTLFAVRKTGSGGGELVSLADASGHGGAFSGTPTVLAAAGTDKAFRGVALAPGWYANRPPAVAVPGDQATPAGTARVFSAGNGNLITVSDPDAGAAAVRLTLSAGHGTSTLAGTAGLRGGRRLRPRRRPREHRDRLSADRGGGGRRRGRGGGPRPRGPGVRRAVDRRPGASLHPGDRGRDGRVPRRGGRRADRERRLQRQRRPGPVRRRGRGDRPDGPVVGRVRDRVGGRPGRGPTPPGTPRRT